MRLLVQRVKSAHVDVQDKTIGKIDRGLLVFFGAKEGDVDNSAVWLADKVCNLRIFSDDEDKMNLSLLDVGGEILIVSQFTLYGNCEKGRRPSFVDAMKPEKSEKLYELFIQEVKKKCERVEVGQFGADMRVHLVNDGPVTLLIEKQ